MKILRLLLCVLLAAGVCACAYAAPLAFSLSPGVDGQAPIDAISTYTSQNTVYLFLPGAWQGRPLHLWFTGAEEAAVNGEALLPGSEVRLPEGGDDALTVAIGTRTYHVRVMHGSAIPALFIATQTGSLDRIEASKEYKEPGEMLMLAPDGSVAFSGALEHMKLRGNMSTRFSKKNYTVKLEKGADLLGMGKAKRWVLTGNARDHSLLRNQITLEMARYAGLAYTPECAQVELYVNGEYRGVYLLSEKVEINDHRIEIEDLEKATEKLNEQELDSFPRVGPAKPAETEFKAYDIPREPEDVTGGYLIEYERYDDRYREEPSAYMSFKGKVLVVKSPEYATVRQMAYITSMLQRFENAIYAKDGTDAESGLHYTQLADLPSLTKKYMVEEISKNYDAANSSQYFYKPADSQSELLFAGPAWDYDTSYGDYGHSGRESILKPEGFMFSTVTKRSSWWSQLFAKEDFQSSVRAEWAAHFLPAMQILTGQKPSDGGLASIDTYAQAIRGSAEMNFIRWPMRTASDNAAETGKTFEANIDYLNRFVQMRLDWLNAQWSSQP